MDKIAEILNIERSHDITPDIGKCSNCGNKVYVDWEHCYYCKSKLEKSLMSDAPPDEPKEIV